MGIRDPRGAIHKHAVIPVLCLECGEPTELHSLVDKVKEALVSMALFQDLLEEKQMLVRAQKLFELFPKSRHASIMCKLYPKDKRPRFEADEAFDQALERDPDLKRFLTKTSFLLPERLAFVMKLIAQCQNNLPDYDLHCQVCSGLLTLDKIFYEHLM